MTGWWRWWIAGVLLVLILPPCYAQDDAPPTDTTLIDQGRALYQQGQRIAADADPLIARINQTNAPLHLFTCAQCHGERGEGQREGGIEAPAIRWDELTKPYVVNTSQYRQRPPYQRQSFIDALRQGHDPAGQTLDPRMPRYQFKDAEIDALVAYLKVIDQDLPMGVSDDEIRIWVRLPGQPDTANALSQLVDAYFDDVNSKGGIYQRYFKRTDQTDDQQPVFIVLDLQGPIPSPQPDTHLPDHALRISLFQHYDGEKELAIWPNVQGMRKALRELAAERWNVAEDDIPVLRTLADFQALSERNGGEKASITILAHDAELDLLEYLLTLSGKEAPELLIEDWLTEIDRQVIGKVYMGKAFSVVPIIPEEQQRHIGIHFQEIVSNHQPSHDTQNSQIFSLLALKYIQYSIQNSSLPSSGAIKMAHWTKAPGRNDFAIKLISLTN
ncbi:MAG: hypothetical protein Tsb002_35470 [Wenzhouxiangellaceae bacterium]